MPFAKRRFFRRFKRKRKAKITGKMVSTLRSIKRQTYSELYTDGVPTGLSVEFVGNADTLAISAVSSFSAVLTTLASGTNVQERPTMAVQVHSIRGKLIFNMPNTATFVGAVATRIRCFILYVRQLLTTDAGAYTSPTLREALGTAATTTAGDMYAPVSLPQLNSTSPNYRIVWDRSFSMYVADSGLHKELRFNIKPRIGQITTYVGTGNNTASASANHYFLYVFTDGVTVANNRPTLVYQANLKYSPVV